MGIKVQYLALNRSYTSPRIIQPEYVVVHSTAAGIDRASALFNAWNNGSSTLSCHGMTDADNALLTLPPNYKGNHIGSLGNSISVGFEVCEPRGIAYLDANHGKVDTSKYKPEDSAVVQDFERRWRRALDMAVYLCMALEIDADHVLCHAEMHKISKGSNHGDVLHWWGLFGDKYGMDAFRAAVQARIGGGSSIPKPADPEDAGLGKGDKVTIKPGAVYGGLTSARGQAVPESVIRRGASYTVSRVEVHAGVPDALISEIYSWVPVRYLEKV